MVFGEISLKGEINIEQIARNAIKEIGYDDVKIGMDYKSATIISHVDQQAS